MEQLSLGREKKSMNKSNIKLSKRTNALSSNKQSK